SSTWSRTPRSSGASRLLRGRRRDVSCQPHAAARRAEAPKEREGRPPAKRRRDGPKVERTMLSRIQLATPTVGWLAHFHVEKPQRLKRVDVAGLAKASLNAGIPFLSDQILPRFRVAPLALVHPKPPFPLFASLSRILLLETTGAH